MAEDGGGGGKAGFLSGTVDIPKIGKVKKAYIAVAVAGVVGVVIYLYWQANQAPVEPITEQPETDGEFDPGGGGGGGGAVGREPTPAPEPGDVIETNGEWFTLASDDLAAAGWDTMAASTALGKFLARKPVTATEVQMIQVALARRGQPPESRPWSIIADTTPAPSVPPTPGAPRIDDMTTSSVVLYWDPVASAATYRVYVDGVKRGDTARTMHQITGLAQGSHKFTLQAVNSAGKASAMGPATTGSTVANITTPAHLRSLSVGSRDIRMGWNGVVVAKHYNLFHNGGRIGPIQSTWYQVKGLKPKTKHSFQVSAVGVDGKVSPKSATVVITTI